MRTLALAIGAIAALGATTPAQAQVGGCLKYGLGGAIVGHFAGNNSLTGAALGCALGVVKRRYESRQDYAERVRREEAIRRQQYQQSRRQGLDEREIRQRQAEIARRQYEEDMRYAERPRSRQYDPDDTGSVRNRQFSPDDTGAIRQRRDLY